MQKRYIKPMMVREEFTANEYIASTCGKTESGKYLFICDAPKGDVYYYPNGKGNGAKYLGGYKPCEAKHETDDPNDFYDGFVDYNNNGTEDDGESKLIWVEFGSLWGYKYEDDWHASASLTKEMVDVVRS